MGFERRVTRRAALRELGVVIGSTQLLPLLGCSDGRTGGAVSADGGQTEHLHQDGGGAGDPYDSGAGDASHGGAGAAGSSMKPGQGGTGGNAGTGSAANGGSVADAGDSADAALADADMTMVDAEVAADGGGVLGLMWATGGTAAMTGKASYPDPFIGDLGSKCEIACQMTIGPCHVASPKRMDVSDGIDGLPLRLSLRIVDDDCKPVVGALIEIWQTNMIGIYSGQLSDLCNSPGPDRTADYFRGYQVTNASGRVDFDTCFPGWYSGRSVHIHVRVLKGAYDASDGATSWETTQLVFDDALVKDISKNQTLYNTRGQPDTLNTNDPVVMSATDLSPYLLNIARMTDGAMQASKTLAIRSSMAMNLCQIGPD